MLEVLNLTKIYKTKGGVNVKALDNVSLRFPETGMVFLLGKSGSGKSTLLNVCGGLDSPTSGEIIVKGKSSKRFSQSDFDSYRNTYVGFIFQEYNILNEFSVEDNIALALELQGKSKDKKAIATLLEEVDLLGYAKRKPHTLSGGQKQRIAIARALIKSPEIIMADEPSGALDSATGKQVFDTLKKLSKDKLVIVVSHDKDFAEYYGDRIIELKDGKVISDVTKTREQQRVVTSNISAVGKTLCVKNAAELSDNDFEEIKDFLKQTNGSVMIASGEHDVKAFKMAARISDSGEKEIFKETDENDIPTRSYKPSDSKFIRSKLPIRHASRIGISSMGNKPVRLFFTMLLCTVAFIFFGLLSTMSFYDSEATYRESMENSNLSLVRLGKSSAGEERWYTYGEMDMSFEMTMEAKFTENELLDYKQKFGADVFGGVKSYSAISIGSEPNYYWSSSVSAFGYLPESHFLRGKINGTYPVKDDEICISSYSADVLYHCKFMDEKGAMVEISSPEDILGKKIFVEGAPYTVTGIFDSGKIPSQYEVLKSEAGAENFILLNAYYNMLSDGLYTTVFVTEEKLATLDSMEMQFYDDEILNSRSLVTDMKFAADEDFNFEYERSAVYSSYSELKNKEGVVWFVSEQKELAEDEIVMDSGAFCRYMSEFYGETYSVNADLAVLAERVKIENIPLILGVKFFNISTNEISEEIREFKIVGVVEAVNQAYDVSKIFLADDVFDLMWNEQRVTLEYYMEYVSDYVATGDEKYSSLYVTYDNSEVQKDLIWNISQGNEMTQSGAKVTVHTSLLSLLQTVDSVVKILSNVFLYVGIVLAVFAALLFSNFISVSISYKKREIGILRAVGARSIDVFKIFFSESFVIAGICVVFSFIGSMTVCKLLNQFIAAEFGTSLFVFGPKSWLVLAAIAMVTAVIATFLPVWNAAKKKPVDSIRSL